MRLISQDGRASFELNTVELIIDNDCVYVRNASNMMLIGLYGSMEEATDVFFEIHIENASPNSDKKFYRLPERKNNDLSYKSHSDNT